jgi:SAM-dependent methyltransferase
MGNSGEKKDWISSYFGDAYLEVYSKYLYNKKEVLEEVDFVIDVLGLEKKSRLLDLACGFGKHLNFFLKRGLNASGIDIALPYLNFASNHIPKKYMKKSPLVYGDMCSLPYKDESFDASVCLFNSFGYVPQLIENPHIEILREIRRCLKPGAAFFLELPNKQPVVDMVKNTPQTFQCGEKFIIHEMWDYDPENKILYNRTNFKVDDRGNSVGYSLRLFTRGEIHKLFKRAGFYIDCEFGDYDGSEWSRSESPFLIIAGRRDG